jgi:hypothetical protein
VLGALAGAAAAAIGPTALGAAVEVVAANSAAKAVLSAGFTACRPGSEPVSVSTLGPELAIEAPGPLTAIAVSGRAGPEAVEVGPPSAVPVVAGADGATGLGSTGVGAAAAAAKAAPDAVVSTEATDDASAGAGVMPFAVGFGVVAFGVVELGVGAAAVDGLGARAGSARADVTTFAWSAVAAALAIIVGPPAVAPSTVAPPTAATTGSDPGAEAPAESAASAATRMATTGPAITGATGTGPAVGSGSGVVAADGSVADAGRCRPPDRPFTFVVEAVVEAVVDDGVEPSAASDRLLDAFGVSGDVAPDPLSGVPCSAPCRAPANSSPDDGDSAATTSIEPDVGTEAGAMFRVAVIRRAPSWR